MPYYTFINGQRYDGSLITNVKFRIRGQGDGRISKDEAQVIWQQAMDGGRITEIEEQTLIYLMQAYVWTDAARVWMEQVLTKEEPHINSYYKIIDGLRYDRRILQKAEELASGRGDGRISQEDAELLLPLFGDFGNVTIEEERSLDHLLSNYSWTEKAKEWFLSRYNPISKESNVFGQVNGIIIHEFKFTSLELGIFPDQLREQTLNYANPINFPEALRAALNNLLTYEPGLSFRRILRNIYGLDPGVSDWEAKLQVRLREWIQGGRLTLLPGTIASEPSLSTFPSPSNKETIADHWIFGLELFDLSDDIYWVIVPRDSETNAYNYVGGPNFEDNWPRE